MLLNKGASRLKTRAEAAPAMHLPGIWASCTRGQAAIQIGTRQAGSASDDRRQAATQGTGLAGCASKAKGMAKGAKVGFTAATHRTIISWSWAATAGHIAVKAMVHSAHFIPGRKANF